LSRDQCSDDTGNISADKLEDFDKITANYAEKITTTFVLKKIANLKIIEFKGHWPDSRYGQGLNGIAMQILLT
jgi:hypothetical protein